MILFFLIDFIKSKIKNIIITHFLDPFKHFFSLSYFSLFIFDNL